MPLCNCGVPAVCLGVTVVCLCATVVCLLRVPRLQIVVLATKSGGLTLRYPVTWRASRSLIEDPHPPLGARGESFSEDGAIAWPLFP